MRIISINHEDKKATLELDISELTPICNSMYQYTRANMNNRLDYIDLKKELDIARDICEYGHIDSFTLKNCLNSEVDNGW